MEHIKRMETELKELNEKRMKLSDFLTSELEKPKFTNEIQRIKMCIQLEYMNQYAGILEGRIEYDEYLAAGEGDE